MPISDTSLHDCGGFHQPGARSVSWNSTGQWLAMGGPSPRIWSIEGAAGSSSSNNSHTNTNTTNATINNNSANIGRCSEVLVISGHGAPVDRVRFHPTEANCLCTSALDSTVRLWDIRAGTERSTGRVDVQSGKSATYLDFGGGGGSGGSSSYLAITERDGSVHVFDSRKLSNATSSSNSRGRSNNNSSSSNTKSTPLSTFRIPGADMDACIFSPSGQHLVAATTKKGEMMADVRIWAWQDGSAAFDTSIQNNTQYTVPAHTGPIFSMAFSPDGKRLATGSSDSIVGVWDVATMCCAVSITKRLKFIRSVAFSNDSRWLANANEEDGIDISSAASGEQVGSLQLRENPTMGSFGGADEIAFNPTKSNGHIIACARAPVGHLAASAQSAAVVIKCRISS